MFINVFLCYSQDVSFGLFSTRLFFRICEFVVCVVIVLVVVCLFVFFDVLCVSYLEKSFIELFVFWCSRIIHAHCLVRVMCVLLIVYEFVV